ncbi:MAG: DsrE family protein [Actinomycetota bacterium]
MGKLLIHSSHGKEDPERATLPFIVGNNAAIAGQDVRILLTIEGVWLATEGGADGVHQEGLPPLAEIMKEYVANGGQVWACQSCTKPRGIGDDRLVEGARIAAAMQAVEFLSQGAASLTF